MASDIDNLKTIRSNAIAQLATLSDPESRKLSYSVDGQSFSWTEYQQYLMDVVERTTKLIQALSPYMIVSRGRS